ncbi:MAG: hypothetical protein QW503_06515 [Sulfolobales archaeon]
MAYRHVKKTITEVIAESLNASFNVMRLLLFRYNVAPGNSLIIRFSGPSDTKVMEFLSSNEIIRKQGVITYLVTPAGGSGAEKDNNLTTHVWWPTIGARTPIWKVDLGAVFPSLYIYAILRNGSTSVTSYYWLGVSSDDENYVDILSGTVGTATDAYHVAATASNVRYIKLDNQGDLFGMKEILVHSTPEVEATITNKIGIYQNKNVNALLDVFIKSSCPVSYWGYLADSIKLTVVEGEIT